MTYLEAFHGDKLPLYEQITNFSFQFMENDLFGRHKTTVIMLCDFAECQILFVVNHMAGKWRAEPGVSRCSILS